MIFKKTIILVALLLTTLSCLYLLVRTEHPTGTFFPHMTHTGDEPDNESCLGCHKGIERSTSLDNSKRYIPTKKACKECHEKPEETAKVQFRPRVNSIIRFNHSEHLKKNKKLSCLGCHKAVLTDKYLPIRGGLPLMKNCKSCHKKWLPDAKHPENVHRQKCEVCHKETIKPRNHYENWKKIHRVRSVGRYKQDCSSCHADKKGCTKCHAGGNFRPEAHDLTWVQTHGFSVRNKIANCQSCHTKDSCQDCHRRRGVSGTPGFKRKFGLSPHPPGWVSDVPGSGLHHGKTARYKLESCKGCHRASDCSTCHVRRYRFGR